MISFKKYLEERKRGLWDNIHAKRARIKAGSGEHMRKPGSKGAPTQLAIKQAQEAINPAQQAAIAIAMKKSGKKPKNMDEAAVDAKGYKSSTGGLTQKGRDHYNSQSGGHLQAPVTTPPSELKAGSKAANRRKSFCARMGGVEGPATKPNGEPTRKTLALRKWNC